MKYFFIVCIVYFAIVSLFMLSMVAFFQIRRFITWVNKSKMEKFVNYHMSEIFSKEKRVIDFLDYVYKPNEMCYEDCLSCSYSNKRKQLKLHFHSLDSYIQDNVNHFGLKFLNLETRSILRDRVLEKIHLKENYCAPQGVSLLATLA